MSDVLPLRRTRFYACSGAPDLEEPSPCRPVAEDPELIMANRRIQLITGCNRHGIFVFARSPQLEM
jgi:hypothetical protein